MFHILNVWGQSQDTSLAGKLLMRCCSCGKTRPEKQRHPVDWYLQSRSHQNNTIRRNIISDRLIRNTPSTSGNSMTSSETPSPEPLLIKEASPPVLGVRELWKCFGAFGCLELWGVADPSRTLEGNWIQFQKKLWVSESESVFRVLLEFLLESPSRAGDMAHWIRDNCRYRLYFFRN